MKKGRGQRLQSKAAGFLALLAVTAALTGCAKAVQGYSVEGGTNEKSMVTDEPFSSVYGTMAYARDESVEETRTQYEGSASAAAGATGPAPEEEQGRKWRTILEDVTLFSSPENGRILMVVPKDSKVDVLTKKKDGWYQIRYRGTVGYVKSGYFVEDWEEEQAERRAREEEEARKKAEEEARKKAEEEAKKKAEEEAKKKAEEEAKKKAEEEARKKAEEEAARKAEEEARAAERARAMANREVTRRLAETVNLRDPDDPEILYGVVPTGSYVTVLADLGDGWYLVDYEGTEGMIKGGYFTEEDP